METEFCTINRCGLEFYSIYENDGKIMFDVSNEENAIDNNNKRIGEF